MDLTDLSILKMLRHDSRESLGNIAQKLGVSKATVSRRISKMEHEGYISGYTIITSSSKLGMMRAMIGLEVVGPAVSSVIEELRQFNEIEYVHKVFGDHNLLCEVYAKSVDSLYDLIQNRIIKVPNIQNVEVDILIEKIPLNPNAELDLTTLPLTNSR
jgi:Lrp/AsnC family transcriptional regulator, regulator for asnA, asnC and gidA